MKVPRAYIKLLMKKDSSYYRYNTLLMILICYLIPIIAICAYAILNLEQGSEHGWPMLSTGLLLSTIGSIALFWRMIRWESLWKSQLAQPSFLPLQESLTAPESLLTPTFPHEEYQSTKTALQEAQEKNEKLQRDLDATTNEYQNLLSEKEADKKSAEENLNLLSEQQRQYYQQMEEQQELIRSLHEQVAEQKQLSEKRQQQIVTLEGKVGDMTYEIKTLLHLAESHSSSLFSNSEKKEATDAAPAFNEALHHSKPEQLIRTPEEASQQLKRCLDIAQKITGSSRFSSRPNAFLDSPADSFSLDLRRLCDRLRGEDNSLIMLYSPKDNQMLFVNNQIKALTGWSPEKFIQTFAEINQSEHAWRQGIASLAIKNETHISISLKNKVGQEVPCQALIGMIPTGIFRQHAIAVLWQS